MEFSIPVQQKNKFGHHPQFILMMTKYFSTQDRLQWFPHPAVILSFYFTLTPSFSRHRNPFSSYSCLEIQKSSRSFMMSARTAPPRNTMCLRRGGSSMRILNFWRWTDKLRLAGYMQDHIADRESLPIINKSWGQYWLVKCLVVISMCKANQNFLEDKYDTSSV